MGSEIVFFKQAAANEVNRREIIKFVKLETDDSLDETKSLLESAREFEVNFIAAQVVDEAFDIHHGNRSEKKLGDKFFELVEILERKVDLHVSEGKIEENKSNDNSSSKLSLNQIALKYCYEGLQITRQNGDDIAKKYGHRSGDKLFQRFTYYSSNANRKGRPSPCTRIKLKNKIDLLNSVIELLPVDGRDKAKDEVNMLKNIFENEYQ